MHGHIGITERESIWREPCMFDPYHIRRKRILIQYNIKIELVYDYNWLCVSWTAEAITHIHAWDYTPDALRTYCVYKQTCLTNIHCTASSWLMSQPANALFFLPIPHPPTVPKCLIGSIWMCCLQRGLAWRSGTCTLIIGNGYES